MRTIVLLIALLSSNVNAQPLIRGADHIGFSVSNLSASKNFFMKTLGFALRGEDPSYPSVFLSNGEITVTLWRVSDGAIAIPFDRKNNVGLHHFAFKVDSEEKLRALYQRLQETDGVKIEFKPEPLGNGPAKHMMIRDPSGLRLEFIHRP